MGGWLRERPMGAPIPEYKGARGFPLSFPGNHPGFILSMNYSTGEIQIHISPSPEIILRLM
jgi:hypothetical protein